VADGAAVAEPGEAGAVGSGAPEGTTIAAPTMASRNTRLATASLSRRFMEPG
jgi:hypothetical protein